MFEKIMQEIGCRICTKNEWKIFNDGGKTFAAECINCKHVVTISKDKIADKPDNMKLIHEGEIVKRNEIKKLP